MRLVDCCNVTDAGVLTLGGAERMQRDAYENNVKQESVQCLTECRRPGEWGKEEAVGSSVLRLADQRKDDVTWTGESWFGSRHRRWFRELDERKRRG